LGGYGGVAGETMGSSHSLNRIGDHSRVLVTGASRGIGREIARWLSDAQYRVYGTSRTPERIPKENVIPGVTYIALDMSDYASIDRMVDEIGHVDILINNAGAGQIGPIEDVSMDDVNYLFRLNLLGIIYLTKKLLPSMRERGRGTIINISSLAGRILVPFSTVYAATKHGLEGYGKGLRCEVKAYGIKVVNICPFGIRTDIAPEARYSADSPYLGALSRILERRSRAHAKAPGPYIVARKVMRILKKRNPRYSYVVGGIAPLLSLLNRILPEKIAEGLHRRVFRLDL
jgi:short-subunit dehydrogenase